MYKNILYILLVSITAANFFTVKGQTDQRKEYKSVENQFSVKYPSNWTIQTPTDYNINDGINENYGVVVFVSPVVKTGDQKNSASIIVCSQPINNKLSNFARTYCGRKDDHLSDIAKDEVIAREEIKVDGIDAEKIVTKRKFEDVYIYYVSFSTKNRKYFISGRFRKSQIQDLDTFKYELEFDKIVNSIKLVMTSD
jgi:hypothetical protein